MRFAQVVDTTGQTTPNEAVYRAFYNSQAVAVSSGDLVVMSATSPDGVKAIQPTSALLSAVLGAVANGDVAASAYGEVQCYGYNTGVLMTNDTNVSLAAGNIMVPVNAADYAAYSAAGDGKTGMIIAMEAYASAATPSAAKKKAFLKCM